MITYRCNHVVHHSFVLLQKIGSFFLFFFIIYLYVIVSIVADEWNPLACIKLRYRLATLSREHRNWYCENDVYKLQQTYEQLILKPLLTPFNGRANKLTIRKHANGAVDVRHRQKYHGELLLSPTSQG